MHIRVRRLKFAAMAVAVLLCSLASGFTAFASGDDDDYDYSISDPVWSDEEFATVAEWDGAADTTSYVVTLYRRTSSVKTGTKIASKTTSNEYYDFSRQVIAKGSGYYYFTVYPKKGSKTDDLITSRNLYVSASRILYMKDIYDDSAEDDGSDDYTAGKAYDFGSSASSSGPSSSSSSGPSSSELAAAKGYKTYYGRSDTDTYSGWTLTDGGWSWVTSDGTAIKNAWLLDNGYWYAFGSDGKMLTGWNWITDADGLTRSYYLRPAAEGDNPEGSMCVSTRIDGWDINADGAWVIDGTVVTR